MKQIGRYVLAAWVVVIGGLGVWFALQPVAERQFEAAVVDPSGLVSALGDPGMTNPNVRVMLYPPYSAQRYGDCVNRTNPTGPGPFGNLVTEADNSRTDFPSNELAIADKCIEPATGKTGVNWYHWNIQVGAPSSAPPISMSHRWTRPDATGFLRGNFAGTWNAINGVSSRFLTRWFTQNVDGANRRVWESTATSASGNPWILLYAPQISEWRQILQNYWAQGSNVVWQARIQVTQATVPATSTNRYRFALPELSSCWQQDGSACDGDTLLPDVTRFFAVDMNPNRIDACRRDYIWNCPPYHITATGTRIARTDAARFPYAAYYYWCGPHTDATLDPRSRCSSDITQEIMQLAPNTEWATHGVPTQPFTVGQSVLYKINIGALTNRMYFWGTRPTNLRWQSIYIGAEIFDPNITVSWQSTNWDLLVPPPGQTTPPAPPPSPPDPGQR